MLDRRARGTLAGGYRLRMRAAHSSRRRQLQGLSGVEPVSGMLCQPAYSDSSPSVMGMRAAANEGYKPASAAAGMVNSSTSPIARVEI